MPDAPAGRWWQAAPVLPLAAPQARVLADSTREGHRHLRVLLQPGSPADMALHVKLPGAAAVRGLRVAGQLLAPADRAQLSASGLQVVAPVPGGTLLEAELLPGTPLRLELAERRLGLPTVPELPPLPADYVPAPGWSSFTTQVKTRIAF